MSLSTLALPKFVIRTAPPLQPYSVRYVYAYHKRALFDGKIDVTKEGAAKIKLQLPGNPKGHLHYERFVSNDPNYKYHISGGTVMRFLFGRIQEERGLWGLYFATLLLMPVLILYEMWSSTNKVEIWVDHSRYGEHYIGDHEHRNPFDWDRIRDNYWKKPVAHMYKHLANVRLPEMEKLQDAMLEESRKRKIHKTEYYKEHHEALH